MDNVNEYHRLLQLLPVDPLNLDDALIGLPMEVMAAGEHTAAAIRARDAAKFNLERTAADVAETIRNAPLAPGMKAPSETQIKSQVLLFDEYEQAETALRDREYEVGLWKALVNGLDTKESSAGKMVNLMQVGYMTRETLYNKQREVMQNAHRDRMQQR